MKNTKIIEEISIFRFGIIAPALNGTHEFSSNSKYFRFAASKSYFLEGVEYNFSESTIKKWYLDYKNQGLQKLAVKKRSDSNSSRKLTDEMIKRIYELKLSFPKITATAIYRKLIKENFFDEGNISVDTIVRYIKKNNITASQITKEELKKFEFEYANDCWQADTTHGPYIKIGDKKYKTYIIAFIDDKSRLLMGFEAFMNDNAINMQKVFKSAIKTYGKPKRLFVDNGGPYSNLQLQLICASLGIELIHAQPYKGSSKGKIERIFNTIKSGWMNCNDWNEFENLQDLNEKLKTYIYNNYLNKVHSSLNNTPNNVWHKDSEYIKRLDNNHVNVSFLHTVKKLVRNDSTVVHNKIYYEVPYKYVKQKIEFKYNPNDLEKLFIYDKDTLLHTCKKVDTITNSKIKRKDNIDYSKILNDSSDAIEMEESNV